MTDEQKRIMYLEFVIEHLKQTLVSEYADQYRSDGAKGNEALNMAKEDAEKQLTLAMNIAAERMSRIG